MVHDLYRAREIEVYVLSAGRLVWKNLFFLRWRVLKLNAAFFFDRKFTCSTSGHRPQTVTSNKFLSAECSTRALIISRRSLASREIRRVMKDGYLSFSFDRKFTFSTSQQLWKAANNHRWQIHIRFVVNKGDRNICCFSQFGNELLSIRQGRAELDY